jgi:hypothetical protein
MSTTVLRSRFHPPDVGGRHSLSLVIIKDDLFHLVLFPPFRTLDVPGTFCQERDVAPLTAVRAGGSRHLSRREDGVEFRVHSRADCLYVMLLSVMTLDGSDLHVDLTLQLNVENFII